MANAVATVLHATRDFCVFFFMHVSEVALSFLICSVLVIKFADLFHMDFAFRINQLKDLFFLFSKNGGRFETKNL